MQSRIDSKEERCLTRPLNKLKINFIEFDKKVEMVVKFQLWWEVKNTNRINNLRGCFWILKSIALFAFDDECITSILMQELI